MTLAEIANRQRNEMKKNEEEALRLKREEYDKLMSYAYEFVPELSQALFKIMKSLYLNYIQCRPLISHGTLRFQLLFSDIKKYQVDISVLGYFPEIDAVPFREFSDVVSEVVFYLHSLTLKPLGNLQDSKGLQKANEHIAKRLWSALLSAVEPLFKEEGFSTEILGRNLESAFCQYQLVVRICS